MEIDEARRFIKEFPRAVLATRRRDGSPQMTPIVAALDEQDRLLISTRETAVKTKNIRRDPRVSLCFLPNNFFGGQVQVDGTAEIIELPEAMELLVDYYKRLSGDHEDWNEYRAAMERDQRLILRIPMERVGPNVAG